MTIFKTYWCDKKLQNLVYIDKYFISEDNMYAGFIYEWTNKKNGMKYLGSHVGTIDDGYIGSGKRFLNAVSKYGIEMFDREIVEYVTEAQNVFAREQHYLDERGCAKRKKYYNISPTACGGDTGAGDKISATKKKMFSSGEIVIHNKGIPMLEERKERMCDEWQVILPTGKEINIKNMREFCKQNNLNPSAMSAIARGKRGQYKGYRCKKLTNNRNVDYEYKEYEYLTSEEKKKRNSEGVKKARREKSTPKIKYNGITYNSLVEAKESTKLSRYLLIKNGELLRND